MNLSSCRGSGGFFSFAGTFAFCSADHELAAHEVLVVKFLDGTLGFIDGVHDDKGVAFRTLSAAMADDFGGLHGADSTEEFLKVLFAGIVGQIADIEAGGGDFHHFRDVAGFRRGWLRRGLRF